jgi:hypothetical protein
MNNTKARIWATVTAAALLTGCVSKLAETTTTNYDTGGNPLTERTEKVKVKGFLATSKTAGLSGHMGWTNSWATNETGAVLTNTVGTVWTLGIAETSFDVSTNAADTIKAGGGAVGEAAGSIVKP